MKLQPNCAYYVAQTRALEGGGTLNNERLSRPMYRITVARRVLKRIRRINPAAYVVVSCKL